MTYPLADKAATAPVHLFVGPGLESLLTYEWHRALISTVLPNGMEHLEWERNRSSPSILAGLPETLTREDAERQRIEFHNVHGGHVVMQRAAMHV